MRQGTAVHSFKYLTNQSEEYQFALTRGILKQNAKNESGNLAAPLLTVNSYSTQSVEMQYMSNLVSLVFWLVVVASPSPLLTLFSFLQPDIYNHLQTIVSPQSSLFFCAHACICLQFKAFFAALRQQQYCYRSIMVFWLYLGSRLQSYTF